MIKIVWAGSIKDPSGYGNVTREYLRHLHEDYSEFVRVRAIARNFFNGDIVALSGRYACIKDMLREKFSDAKCFIQNLTPNTFVYDKSIKYHIGMTTFETDGLPSEWLLNMQAMDEIWTYTKFNKETFENAGITRPIHIIPHGVDSDRFSPATVPFTKFREAMSDRFIFGSVFDWTERKNPVALLSSFIKAFQGRKDVVLLLKCYFQFPLTESRNRIIQQINMVKSSLGITDAPDIYLIDGILPDSKMPSFYSTLDAYISCSRGEGWNMPCIEAMATALPTIATGWSGNTEYMDPTNSYLIPYTLEDIPESFFKYFPHYAGQKWASVNEDALIDTLRSIVNDRKKSEDIGMKARTDVVEKWSWHNAVDKIFSRLGEV